MNPNEINQYPSIFKRYLAALVDGMIVVSLIWITFSLNNYSILYPWILLLILLTYEPLLTSKACTLGQKIMGFRIRRSWENEKISYIDAVLRYALKITLGIVSLLTIPVSKHRRAVHDIGARSVAIIANSIFYPIEDKPKLEKLEPLTEEDKDKWTK